MLGKTFQQMVHLLYGLRPYLRHRPNLPSSLSLRHHDQLQWSRPSLRAFQSRCHLQDACRPAHLPGTRRLTSRSDDHLPLSVRAALWRQQPAFEEEKGRTNSYAQGTYRLVSYRR
ncbi:hypothetical protein M406DRAFT_102109, partial [Cryphonectria parasitica EP155]